MIKKMPAIEYNLLMTLLSLFDVKVKGGIGISYGVTYPISVLPAYPRDLSKFHKPAIIIRKVGTDSEPIGMGGVLGQHYDIDTNTIVDVSGINHEITVQLDVCTDDTTSNELITSMLTEAVLHQIILEDGGRFPLYNFIKLSDINQIGECKLRHEISITNVEESSMNHDYSTAIRFDINIIQAIVPDQELVDLSKWIKFSYKIN